MRQARRQGEHGYALLAVFLMAALVALFLYSQLPRVAFESERDKEQTLIDRGEQYKRAIQLYVIATKKYPQKIEDLEDTNNKRYLRRRYIDPFTGKDEWRLIHVNAAGILTDSLVQKTPTADGKTPPAGGPLASTPSTPDPATAAADANDVNAAVKRRPSDVVGQAYTQPVAVDPNDPKTWAPITIATPSPAGTANGQPPSGAVGFNGGLQGQQTVPGQAGFPGQFPAQAVGQNPAAGGFQLPGQPGFNPTQNQFKIDANGQLVPVTPTPTPNGAIQNAQQPAAGPTSPPGATPGAAAMPAQNAATAAINNMLTNPNPVAGGLGTSAGMTTGGIAGVASMYKGPSIKIYAKKQKYQEWEFIFSLTNGQNGTAGQPRNPLQPGQNGGTPGGTAGASGTPSGTVPPTSTPPSNP